MLIQEKVNQANDLLKEFNIDCRITFVRESSINETYFQKESIFIKDN